jgi:polyhydroxyalkanoate synthesis repressor PhaR
MSDAIVLKKYGNRRLYDTSESKYVTLVEVESMLQRGLDVRVVDAKTGEDLTKEILVQIILEREGARDILPTAFLKQIVRVAGSPWKDSFATAVQQSVVNLVDGQRAVIDAQKSFASQVASQVAQLAPQMFNPFSAFAPAPPSSSAPPRDPEIDRLKAQLDEQQSLLRRLVDRAEATDPRAKPKRIVRRNKKA